MPAVAPGHRRGLGAPYGALAGDGPDVVDGSDGRGPSGARRGCHRGDHGLALARPTARFAEPSLCPRHDVGRVLVTGEAYSRPVHHRKGTQPRRTVTGLSDQTPKGALLQQ
ncbi:hypothetical protein GCM10018785_10210 [Streptomyces longispororuber]|uniref:Uncharacterized protein n=1 Tax=Streptomyces longispororuber TaxID=68230 RepID=A0A919DH58_9ACTN|nr:hypothetical protein GCM10018785_10210 [Streptomyces longispororuber]